jgi:hypothetical protein
MTTLTPEQLQEVCDFSLLYRYECAHCTTMDDSDITPDHDYEIVTIFPSQFGGYCTLDDRHRIRKGDRVSKLRRADNPMVSVPGVACQYCTLDLPKARK